MTDQIYMDGPRTATLHAGTLRALVACGATTWQDVPKYLQRHLMDGGFTVVARHVLPLPSRPFNFTARRSAHGDLFFVVDDPDEWDDDDEFNRIVDFAHALIALHAPVGAPLARVDPATRAIRMWSVPPENWSLESVQ